MPRVVLSESDYPSKLTIGKSIYTVIFVNKLPGAYGMLDDSNKLLIISRDQDPDEMLATFAHECAHAIECEAKIKIGHPMIRKIEYPLAQIISQFFLRS